MRRKNNDKLYPAIGRTGTPTKKKKLPTTVQEIRKLRDWTMWRRMWRNPRTSQQYRNRRNDVMERLEAAECWHGTHQIKVQQAGGKNGGLTNGRFAPKLMSVRRQIGHERGCKKTRNLPEQGAENAANTETRPCTEGRAAKIRKVENWRCRTAQAVKVWHPRMEIWWERNSCDSRVAQGDVSRMMRPTDMEGFQKHLMWRAIESKFRESRIHLLRRGRVYVLTYASSKMLRKEQI